MSITKNGSNEIVYAVPATKARSDATGTVVDEEFAIVDNTNVLKQIQFRINPTDTSPGILTVVASVGADATVDLTGIAGSDVGITRIIYVSKGGTDATAVAGSINHACLTIAKALTLVVSGSTTNRYIIDVGPGVFTESVVLKPWVWLRGTAASGLATIDDAASTRIVGNITYSSNTASPRLGIANLEINGDLDLTLTSGSGTARDISICHVGVTGAANFIGRVGSDQFDIDDLFVAGAITVGRGTSMLRKVYSQASIDYITSNAVDTTSQLLLSSTPSLSLTGGTKSVSVIARGNWADAISLADANCSLNADSPTIPWTGATLNGGTLIYASGTQGLVYVPAVTANWNNSDPTNLQEALDRIAAKVGPIT